MAPTDPIEELNRRLEAVEQQAQKLQQEGLPFPITQIRSAFDEATRSGAAEKASLVVKRAEALLARVSRDWGWVRELLRRVDELRAISQDLGVDLAHLDARVGNPRARLMSEPLSAGSLEKAAASASLALAVLNDAVPKFCVQEAQALGTSIRRARDRGEDTMAAAVSFSRLLQAVQDENLPMAAQRLAETRKIVARIPRAPTVARISPKEEEDILLEARNLARRLQRIKTSARDATSAARLMTQVRAALAEDRRYGTPEEEIEALWQEVDRLTQEKRRAVIPPPIDAKDRPVEPEEGVPEELLPPEEPAPEPEAADAEDERIRSSPPFSFYVPYVPPDLPETSSEGAAESGTPPRRSRPRPRP
ncbi:MAG TPA: hypothetical protein VML94_02435 [Thermoplasmata archaeon]|nr:hypothetical protein [Thermoplasmata archaeon]